MNGTALYCFYTMKRCIYGKKPDDTLVAEKFSKSLHIPHEKWPSFLKEVVMPLTNEYNVSFDKSLIKETKEGEPDITVMLVERGDYLLFQPVFSYKGFSVKREIKKLLLFPKEIKF